MSKALCVMVLFVIILNLNTICTAGESEHELGLCSNMNRLIPACPKMPCYVYLITCPLHVAATFDWKVCIEKTKKNWGQGRDTYQRVAQCNGFTEQPPLSLLQFYHTVCVGRGIE